MIVKTLQSEIIRGVHPVGTQLPSEALLMGRFGVSRQTVRQALRAMREAGLVRTHQGLGTLVERAGVQDGYVHHINRISDLFPLNVVTRYEAVDGALQRLPYWARFIPKLDNEEMWLHVRGHRFYDDKDIPFNALDVFIAARFAGVGRIIGTQAGSIYASIELLYGETIDEVEQYTSGFRADAERGASIGLKPGDVGIEIRRLYRVASDNKVALISFNRYRPDDFTSSLTLRRAKNAS